MTTVADFYRLASFDIQCDHSDDHAGDFCGKIVPLLSRDVKGQRCFLEAF